MIIHTGSGTFPTPVRDDDTRFVDLAARITIALLNKLAANGPVNPPFSAVRMI